MAGTSYGGCVLPRDFVREGVHLSNILIQGWTARRLQTKSAANVSKQLSRAKKAAKPKVKPAKPTI
jgi:hypothetical protein